MQLKYGNYTHADNECSVVISKDAECAESGEPLYVHERWDVQGRMHAASQAALVTALANLQNAYDVNGGNLALYGESGITHSLASADCQKGTIVTRPPSYPKGEGAEFSTFRSYALTVEGTRQRSSETLISYREALNWTGTGGPSWGYLVPLVGDPIPQILTQTSIVTITQEGNAIGYGYYPLAPSPLWPSYEIPQEHNIRKELPGLNTLERQISWRFVFQAPAQLIGLPGAL